MSPAEVEVFRQQLLRLRDRLQSAVAQLTEEALQKGGGEASGGSSHVPLHPELRLRALPHARHCVAWARKFQQGV